MIMSMAIVKVAFFVRIVNGVSRISLRSKGKIDVASVAGVFGGGGHFNAAGCTIDSLNIEEVRQKVLKEVIATT